MKNFLVGSLAPFLVILQLTACDSGLNGQIDKCVAAGLASNGPYKNSTEKAGDEITIRAFCMRAAAGKD
jgi:hypothetical protein